MQKTHTRRTTSAALIALFFRKEKCYHPKRKQINSPAGEFEEASPLCKEFSYLQLPKLEALPNYSNMHGLKDILTHPLNLLVKG
jgi:hypothetical protein